MQFMQSSPSRRCLYLRRCCHKIQRCHFASRRAAVDQLLRANERLIAFTDEEQAIGEYSSRVFPSNSS